MRISNFTEHLLLVMLVVGMAGIFVHQNLLWRWDNLVYDTQLSFWSRSVSNDIVIIAIDDQSLNDIGHWPWPRSTHAELINRLQRESPRVIGLDILFSEADSANPRSDQLLSEAMYQSGKVVLPVYMSRQSRNALPIEALPLPIFTQPAAALGHVYVDIGSDGIARRIYLREGIGKPHWNHFSLAVLNAAGINTSQGRHDKTDIKQKPYSPMQWSREQALLIPYAGPPGHFPSIGYSQVLKGDYAKNFFHDKIVLIGATAEGMGDALPTPFSGGHGNMSGVEIIANMTDALRKDLRITQITATPLILLTMLLVALPILLYPYMNPAHTLTLMFGMILLTGLLVALLLWWFGTWVPVATILLFQLLSYPLWSWRRLVLAMRHLNFELDQLLARQSVLSLDNDRHLASEIEFLSAFIALDGWVVYNAQGRRMLYRGSVPPRFNGELDRGNWYIRGNQWWSLLPYQGQVCRIGLILDQQADIDADQQRMLDNLIQPPRPVERPGASYLEDIFQTRINQVQTLANEYEALHRIIDDSLSGMAHGVLICDSRGQVMFSNRRAGWYLQGNDNSTLNGKSVIHTLQQVTLNNNASWPDLLLPVMRDKTHALSEAQHVSGRDLMVEVSPLQISGDPMSGFVLNFSDISFLKATERKRSEALNFLSHDLRSPLSSMVAMIELARSKDDITAMRDMLAKMESNTYKTLHLAEQFLQLSRANTHEKLEFHELDINSIVLNAIDQLWALSNRLQVTIEADFEQEEQWTYGEPDLLERAIVNLLSNAIKHSAAGSSVTVDVNLQEAHICCCVIDRGSGISSQDLPQLFDSFSRTQSSALDRKPGIGLGLAFVDAVARRHNGRVEVQSELGKGSSFCLNLPLQKPPIQ